MDQDAEVLFETWLGRDRRQVQITRAEFRNWIECIQDDQALVASIHRVLSGKEKWHDLDEGGAGIFPERIFPYEAQVIAKLRWLHPDEQMVMGSFLFHKMLDVFKEGHSQ